MKKTIDVFGRQYSVYQYEDAEAMAVIRSLPISPTIAGELSCAVFYDESRGWINFVSTGNSMGWVGADGSRFKSESSEYVFDIQPETYHHFECMGNPKLGFEYESERVMYWSAVMQDIAWICKEEGLQIEHPVAFNGHLTRVELESSVIDSKGNRLFMDEVQPDKVDVFGFFFQEPEHINREQKALRRLSEFLANFPLGGSISGIAFALFENEPGEKSVRFIEPESMFKSLKLDVFEMFGS